MQVRHNMYMTSHHQEGIAIILGGIMIVLYLTSTKAKVPKHLAKKEPNKMLRGAIFNLPFLMC